MGITVEYSMSVGNVMGRPIRRIGSICHLSRRAIYLEVACVVVDGVVAVDISIDNVADVGGEESPWGAC